MSNGNGQKDTIYIDIDDEITAVIDKLRGSPHRIVALVLPKRAAVFQSIVNMKLLKRTADEAKKHVVLITAETALLPLAGAVGLHAAPNLQSKPEIPPGPKEQDTSANVSEGAAPLDPNAPVGHLAAQANDDAIQVDNSPKKPEPGGKDKKGKSAKAGDGKRKIKVPNFERFRKRFVLAGLAGVLLIVGIILAFFVLPKATITLKTETSELDTNLTFTADTAAKAFDQENNLLPAISKEFRRTDTERVPATGQIDKGSKASGSLVLTNCSKATGSITIPAGTGISSGNLTYISATPVNLPESSFNSNDECKTSSQSVGVTAEKPGEQYNISSGRDFNVAGYAGIEATNSSPLSGGTSNVVKVVSQADIDKGKQAIQNRANNAAPDDLVDDIKDEDFYPIEESLVASDPTVTTDRNANDEAEAVTVTSTTVYTMVGVKENDLKKLIEADAKKRIDTGKQAIRNNGLSKASFRVQKAQNSQTTLILQARVVVGPQLDSGDIKKEIAGKSRSETEETLQDWPDIADIEVKYSPFWVRSTPKSESKINIQFEDAGRN